MIKFIQLYQNISLKQRPTSSKRLLLFSRNRKNITYCLLPKIMRCDSMTSRNALQVTYSCVRHIWQYSMKHAMLFRSTPASQEDVSNTHDSSNSFNFDNSIFLNYLSLFVRLRIFVMCCFPHITLYLLMHNRKRQSSCT